MDRPVAGATVALVPIGLFDPSGARYTHVESAPDGGFRLTGVGDDRHAVTATAPGQSAGWLANVRAGDAGLRLRLGTGGRLVSGRVSDRAGRPRSGVMVRLARGLGELGHVFLVASGVDGSWRALLPDGDYHASALHEGYAAAQKALPSGRDAARLVLEPVWPGRPPTRAVLDWLRSHASRLTTAEPGGGLADLASLRAVVGAARVVGLGEATHGTREIFQLKHRLLEFLVSEMGFTVFAIELSLPDSFAIDEYVMGGDGDPDRLLAGQSAVWQTEELREVLRWIRQWNATHARKVRFHGLDMRAGVRAARETLAYLTRTDPAALSSPAWRALAPMADPFTYQDVIRRPGPQLAALAERARELAARFDSRRARYVARTSIDSWWRSVMQVQVLAQLLDWRAAVDDAARVRTRERAMAENAIRALAYRGPDARAVVWAHNAHIAGDVEAEPKMMGVHLREHLGARYRAIGSAIHRGSYQAVDPTTHLLRDFAIAPAPPGSLEATLASAAGPLALVDLRALPATGAAAEWFQSFVAMRHFDGLYEDRQPAGWANPVVIAVKDYDALLFVSAGAAARPLPYATALHAQEPPRPGSPTNFDLEESDGARPRGWSWSARGEVCGYEVTVDLTRPFAGRAGARIARTRERAYGECGGQLRQLIDAAAHRGKQIRLRAAVRVERAGDHAHLYLNAGARRVSRIVTGSRWRVYELALDVPDDADSVDLGLTFDGQGAAWLDAVSLTDGSPPESAGPRPGR